MVTFDMGPSWYWMPDVFDRFFADFGKKTTDYYELIKLSPAYRVYFGVDEFITIADNLAKSKLPSNPLKALSCTNLLLRQKQL
jgi:phytoene dehydrogenase-like protein